jgi:hypothetical protein
MNDLIAAGLIVLIALMLLGAVPVLNTVLKAPDKAPFKRPLLNGAAGFLLAVAALVYYLLVLRK